jgi:hypothetical protein
MDLEGRLFKLLEMEDLFHNLYLITRFNQNL